MHTLRFPIAHRIHLAASFFGTNDEFAWGPLHLLENPPNAPKRESPMAPNSIMCSIQARVNKDCTSS
jgi:hypothetical protein